MLTKDDINLMVFISGGTNKAFAESVGVCQQLIKRDLDNWCPHRVTRQKIAAFLEKGEEILKESQEKLKAIQKKIADANRNDSEIDVRKQLTAALSGVNYDVDKLNEVLAPFNLQASRVSPSTPSAS